MPRPRREYDAEGRRKCPLCKEFKGEEHFASTLESYCKPCKRAYMQAYNERRKREDPTYLPMRAAKAKRQYRTSPDARALRIDSTRKYQSKLKREAKLKEEKGIMPEPRERAAASPEGPPELPPRVAAKEHRQEVDKRWQDI